MKEVKKVLSERNKTRFYTINNDTTKKIIAENYNTRQILEKDYRKIHVNEKNIRGLLDNTYFEFSKADKIHKTLNKLKIQFIKDTENFSDIRQKIVNNLSIAYGKEYFSSNLLQRKQAEISEFENHILPSYY
jgi:hypothetical protein